MTGAIYNKFVNVYKDDWAFRSMNYEFVFHVPSKGKDFPRRELLGLRGKGAGELPQP
jgi:hypothetical protein